MATSNLFTRALEAGPAEQGDDTHERILDAALVEAESKGLERITMDAVAARAKVGRMTVYRRFGSKEELTTALAHREASRSLMRIAAAVDPAGTIPAQVADGFVAALETARSHPLLQRLARFEPEVLLASLQRPDDPLFSMLRGLRRRADHSHRRRCPARRSRRGGGDPGPHRRLLSPDPGRRRGRERRG